jgi:hypothetical protein
MRLDDWLPVSTAVVHERHVMRIRAPADAVYRALWRADFGGIIARMLLAVRLVPAMLSDWRHARERLARHGRADAGLTLQMFLQSGFAQLEAVENEELVLGLSGRFWTPSGGLTPTSAETFRAGPAIGHAQAAWNFRCDPADAETTSLSTETRVRVAPGAARSRFLAYWFVVRPFSGLLRVLMLRAVRREAEGAHRAGAG